jgi:regulation of enolase protein 1 (concanavalin A-like superfamily)
MNVPDLAVPALPSPLRWLVAARGYDLGMDGTLRIDAGPRTDWFIDPGGAPPVRDAPALVMPAIGAWQLKATVSAEHRATFDAAVLFVHAENETWAKLCLERSPFGTVMVVSVVTRGRSDDSNHMSIDGGMAHLRISRLEQAFAFHTSRDGRQWEMVRYFDLGERPKVEVGFMAQSPTGDGCTATFRAVHFANELLADVRSGV